MIPGLQSLQAAWIRSPGIAFFFFYFMCLCVPSQAGTPSATADTATDGRPGLMAVSCLPSGDGYFKARLQGAIDAQVDWPNAGTRCEGEERPNHNGLRLSFRRDPASAPDLLFVLGISNVRENQSVHGAAVNVTIIEQGGSRIFGTQGDSRCTMDSLRQWRLPEPPAQPGAIKSANPQPRRYRVEGRGFCTSPAHAVNDNGSLLLTTFDFTGVVRFDGPEHGA